MNLRLSAKFISAFLLISGYLPNAVYAQTEGSLLDSFDLDIPRVPVTASFKSSRVVNSQSLEITDPGVLDIHIQHRFGTLNSGAYELWGLDLASIRIGADLGITKGLMVGVGRSSVEHTVDFYTKWKPLAQTTDNHIPFSVLLFSSMAYRGMERPGMPADEERISTVNQIIVGRKFSSSFSFQLMPTWVYHQNPLSGGSRHVYGTGAAFRLKLTPRTSLNAEYTYFPAELLPDGCNNPFSIGFDIETGGHVFQLHVTNGSGMTDKSYLTETTGAFFRGNIRPGFNITRVFTLWNPR
jgi:hypothetical protein